MTNYLKVEKRQKWVNHLFEQNCITTTRQYKQKQMHKIQRKLPKHIEKLKRVELQQAIATMITNSNETWNNLRKDKYKVPKSYFQTN
jgi:hypothetical protein